MTDYEGWVTAEHSIANRASRRFPSHPPPYVPPKPLTLEFLRTQAAKERRLAPTKSRAALSPEARKLLFALRTKADESWRGFREKHKSIPDRKLAGIVNRQAQAVVLVERLGSYYPRDPFEVFMESGIREAVRVSELLPKILEKMSLK